MQRAVGLGLGRGLGLGGRLEPLQGGRREHVLGLLGGGEGVLQHQHIIYMMSRSNSFAFASHVFKYNIIFLETLDTIITILLDIEGEGECQMLFIEKEVCFQCFSLNVCSVYENALAENLWKYSRKSIDSDSLAERARPGSLLAAESVPGPRLPRQHLGDQCGCDQ